MFRTLSMIAAKKGESAARANPLLYLVPEIGIEPTLPRGKGDLECKIGDLRKAIDFKYILDFNGLSICSGCWEK